MNMRCIAMSAEEPISTETLRVGTESRYDILLAVLPLPLILGLFIASAAQITLAIGAALGGVLSAVVLAYGLFIDSPTPTY